MSERTGIRVGLLGPLTIDGSLWRGRSAQWRIALALFALNAGIIVSYDTLAAALWGDSPPSNRDKALQSCVERLQAKLGPDGPRILNQAGLGYWLDLEPDAVDVHVFARLCRQGRALAAGGQWDEAARVLQEALDLRRSTPFLDVGCRALESEWIPYLRGLWTQALQDQARAGLHLGQHEHVIPQLEWLTRDHPAEDRFWALLMLAQYRSGRRRDAEGTFYQAQIALKREVGDGPDELIEHIHRQIASRVPAGEIPVP